MTESKESNANMVCSWRASIAGEIKKKWNINFNRGLKSEEAPAFRCLLSGPCTSSYSMPNFTIQSLTVSKHCFVLSLVLWCYFRWSLYFIFRYAGRWAALDPRPLHGWSIGEILVLWLFMTTASCNTLLHSYLLKICGSIYKQRNKSSNSQLGCCWL